MSRFFVGDASLREPSGYWSAPRKRENRKLREIAAEIGSRIANPT
jgi:hypothetical protein